jgi:Ca2+-binding EF-hand superfamily protein
MQANYEKLRGEMMQKYDTNGDGQLDDNERQARDASRLQQYDKNGDGQIDDEERAAMPEYERVRGSRRGGGGGGGPGGFGFGGGGGPGGFRGGFGGGPLPEFMKQYDTNGDGQLNEQEQAAMQTAMRADFEKRQAEQLKKYDANHNGQLDEKEMAAMRADYDTLRAEMMKKYDTNGDGQLDDNERTARDAARLKAYDRNADGKLDESEAASMPEFERVRTRGFGGPGGPGGFGGGFGGGGGFARGGGDPSAGGTRRPAQLPGNVKKYDTNNDGKLDDAERKAMQADQAKPKKPSGTTKPTSTKSGQAKI